MDIRLRISEYSEQNKWNQHEREEAGRKKTSETNKILTGDNEDERAKDRGRGERVTEQVSAER